MTWYIKHSDDELCHYGVKGQKWGVVNKTLDEAAQDVHARQYNAIAQNLPDLFRDRDNGLKPKGGNEDRGAWIQRENANLRMNAVKILKDKMHLSQNEINYIIGKADSYFKTAFTNRKLDDYHEGQGINDAYSKIIYDVVSKEILPKYEKKLNDTKKLTLYDLLSDPKGIEGAAKKLR